MSEQRGSGETARMRSLAWTFAARIGDKYQIRLTRPNYDHGNMTLYYKSSKLNSTNVVILNFVTQMLYI